jgi:hypothetical protein
MVELHEAQFNMKQFISNAFLYYIRVADIYIYIWLQKIIKFNIHYSIA